MPTDTEADHIRLRLPATGTMTGVVRVAVRVLGGRAGLAERTVEVLRTEVGDAFEALVAPDPTDGGTVELLATVTAGTIVVELTGPRGQRTVTAGRERSR